MPDVSSDSPNLGREIRPRRELRLGKATCLLKSHHRGWENWGLNHILPAASPGVPEATQHSLQCCSCRENCPDLAGDKAQAAFYV